MGYPLPDSPAHTPDAGAVYQPASGGHGWLSGSRRWVAAGVLAVLLATGIGAVSYAVGNGADGGDGTNQADGDGGDWHGRDGGEGNAGDDSAAIDEEPLTGADLAGVTEAVEGEYPGSIIVEADADGVLEAHIVTAEGDEVTVELDEDYAITGIEEDR